MASANLQNEQSLPRISPSHSALSAEGEQVGLPLTSSPNRVPSSPELPITSSGHVLNLIEPGSDTVQSRPAASPEGSARPPSAPLSSAASQRTIGPRSDAPGASSTRANEQPLLVLEKFALYETKQRLYVVASNQSDSRYRVLKIDRTSPVGEVLPVTEDGVIYSRTEVTDLLKMIEEGNRNSGGLVRACPSFYGIVGT
jgi:hypothetical protein